MRFIKQDLARWFQRPSHASNDDVITINALDLVDFFGLPAFAENRILQLSPHKLAHIDSLRVHSLRQHLAYTPHDPIWKARLGHTEIVMVELGYSELEVRKHLKALRAKHGISEPAPAPSF